MIEFKEFNANTVSLEGSNLIEASAGTGKTYSIAVLVLRLILEKKIPIKEILMVTFTKAAVAELEERIRLFVRSAHKAAMGNKIEDDNILHIVKTAIDTFGTKQVQEQLKDAILFLDETSVQTIHSFCQHTLNEFAFETNQLFGTELVTDVNAIIEEELNKFWRKNITTLRTDLLKILCKAGSAVALRAKIHSSLTTHLSGKKYYIYDDNADYKITTADQEQWIKDLESVGEETEQLTIALHNYISTNSSLLKDACEKNSYARKAALQQFVDTPIDFENLIREKKKSGYIQNLFPEILNQIDVIDSAENKLDVIRKCIYQNICCLAIKEISEGVDVTKQKNNLLTYDDIISNLHNAIVKKNNPTLVAALRKKYKAVFIDEFQDTDKQQYEIFEKAFCSNTILFYIGDPKQSIYAWRKADVFTYFKARDGVESPYSMNRNYRSSPAFIAAMNKFFLPRENFDTFYFTGEQDSIDYINVDSPEKIAKGAFYKDDAEDVPISVFTFQKNDYIARGVAQQVALLLTEGPYQIEEGNCRRAVKPSDIGILVRKNSQGNSIKSQLATLGIPAITIDGSKVLQSEEATELLYLMEAIVTPDRSSINRALLSSFTGYNKSDIKFLNNEQTLSLFDKYKVRWQKAGIYTALMDFIADFDVRNVLLHSAKGGGERIITNLTQLIELLHRVQSRKNLSMLELISWLKRAVNGMPTEGDEYEQRIESDEEAVKIVTIHKSKGLEYNIVIAPFLDFAPNSKQTFFSLRHPHSEEYVSIEKDSMTEDLKKWQEQQDEQENRRLLYVAITRAVYKCYVYKSTYYTNSTLSTFIHELKNTDSSLIKYEEEIPDITTYYSNRDELDTVEIPCVNFVLQHENWKRMSYTMLAAKPYINQRVYALYHNNEYDNFIFTVLKRGAKTGNLLHYIFENINFVDNLWWNRIIEDAIKKFAPNQREVYFDMLQNLLRHTLQTKITIDDVSFTLDSISHEKQIAEFEFDFPVPQFLTNNLNLLSDNDITINIKQFGDHKQCRLEGVVNGKMDLFFEHEGKYYILDWKSNHLGNTLADYSSEALADAMNESNYHLQYLLYTLAAKKYLESRIHNFDYETQFGGVIYLFVRGIRNDSSTGVFTTKPTLAKVEQLENCFLCFDI